MQGEEHKRDPLKLLARRGKKTKGSPSWWPFWPLLPFVCKPAQHTVLKNSEAFWDGRAILTACWTTWHCFLFGTCHAEHMDLPAAMR